MQPITTEQAKKTPYRQIRAVYDDDSVTVYQAYNAAIAGAAVAAQRLDASPLFGKTRMTWIKPSWAWMLYRAGYSYKDKGQERILALKVRRADFVALLERAVLTHGPGRGGGDGGGDDDGASRGPDPPREGAGGAESGQPRRRTAAAAPDPTRGSAAAVKVQWDPERTVRLERLDHRSIQIGVSGAACAGWVADSIVGIEDVTDRARELKRVLDEEPDVSHEELVRRGLVPVERPFEVSAELRANLQMGVEGRKDRSAGNGGQKGAASALRSE